MRALATWQDRPNSVYILMRGYGLKNKFPLCTYIPHTSPALKCQALNGMSLQDKEMRVRQIPSPCVESPLLGPGKIFLDRHFLGPRLRIPNERSSKTQLEIFFYDYKTSLTPFATSENTSDIASQEPQNENEIKISHQASYKMKI